MRQFGQAGLGRIQTQHVGHAPVHVGGVSARIQHPDALVGGLDDAAELDLAGGQAFFGLAAGAALGGFTQLAFDGGRKACQVVFDQYVVRAGLQDLDRGFLAHGSGNHQERNVRSRLFENVDGRQCIEPGQRVVADHHIPGT